MTHHSNAKGVAWVALVIALIALIFSWIAFNETGSNLDQRVENEVQEVLQTQQTQQQATSSQTDTDTTTQPEPAPDADEATTTTNQTDNS